MGSKYIYISVPVQLDNNIIKSIQKNGFSRKCLLWDTQSFWINLKPPFLHYGKFYDPGAKYGEYGHSTNTFWDQFWHERSWRS